MPLAALTILLINPSALLTYSSFYSLNNSTESFPQTANCPAIINDSALLPSVLFSVIWKNSLGSHEKQFKFKQLF